MLSKVQYEVVQQYDDVWGLYNNDSRCFINEGSREEMMELCITYNDRGF